MKIIRFILSKYFWINLAIAIAVVAALLYATTKVLDSYTKHGEFIEVPDLNNYSISEAEEMLTEVKLRAMVLDSSEYNPDYPRGAVVDQYPSAGSKVKEDREIKLTVNPRVARKYELPDLIGETKRAAEAKLRSYGFRLGELEYRPHIAKDEVLGMKVNGKEVEPKTKLVKRTVIDLVLGQGRSDTKVAIPPVVGITLDEASERIKSFSLNVGAVTYDEEVQDSTKCMVYRQSPAATNSAVIRMGSDVDIWLTDDNTKIPIDTFKVVVDSVNIDSIR